MTRLLEPTPARCFRPLRRAVLVAGAMAVTAALPGCVADPAEERAATFVLPETEVVQCQEHQEQEPSSAYAGDEDSDTVAMLNLLRYWAENGDKPYCDGEPATDTDLQWAQTVERLRGTAPESTG